MKRRKNWRKGGSKGKEGRLVASVGREEERELKRKERTVVLRERSKRETEKEREGNVVVFMEGQGDKEVPQEKRKTREWRKRGRKDGKSEGKEEVRG